MPNLFRRSSSASSHATRGRRRSTTDRPRGAVRRWVARLVPRSVAGQVMLLQAVVVLLLAAAAVTVVILQAEHDSMRDARHRSIAAAETFAAAPSTVQALSGPNPSAVLQPYAEAARSTAGVEFIVVVDPNGTILTHPEPNSIGKPVPSSVQGLVTSGRSMTEVPDNPRERAVTAAAPVRGADGRLLGTVLSGITTSSEGNVVQRQIPVLIAGTAGALALTAVGTGLVNHRLRRQTHSLGPAEITRMYEHHDAVLHAVREGVLIIDSDGRLILANDETRRLLNLRTDAEGRGVGELGLEPEWVDLLVSDRPVTDEVRLRGDRLLAVNKRLTTPGARASGSVVTLRDSTELEKLAGRAESTRRRLRLLYEAGVRIGTTLDVARTARELAEVAVPEFADQVTVDLLEQVLRGEEPPGTVSRMRRVASHGVHRDALHQVDKRIELDPESPSVRAMADGDSVLVPALAEHQEWRSQDPEHAQELLEQGVHSLIAVPLRARGVVLGVAGFWRGQTPEPFDEDDTAFAEELTARAAVSVDNARRFTREHTVAATLQRSLLPRGLPDQDAMEVAHRYLPAEAGVGGDWFDVIPLPGARVALVVGDVVGHGLHAAATMGRLRTAVHNFSTLDLAPDELLSHLDDLVASIDQDSTGAEDTDLVTGATCLYAIYDPTSGTLTAARAGHPGPVLLFPDGRVTTPDIPVTPPLGLGAGMPVETADLTLPEGTQVVMFTDGLIEDRTRDLDTGLELLHATLRRGGPAADPEQICADVVSALVPDRRVDDIALLIARTHRLGPDQVSVWDVPRDPAAVAPIRAACARRLHAWGLDEIGFTTELILSELLTNAVRYGHEPIQVRLLRGESLICEVSDASSTSPHLRRAAPTDEGGRGLFLVARYAERWGTRYTARGKIIWAEQALHGHTTGAAGEDTDALLAQWDDL